ncbi:MAG: anthranilate synthase component I, partial [Gemmatales bacterium]|nr:anthranilate synthase component I [Gemmatales bacterium]MDW8224388.1 anthranilate synthase component I [Gemmatales bacterium]
YQAWDRHIRIDDLRAGAVKELDDPDPLKLLEHRLAEFRAPNLPGLPRFCGGAVGYAGYDTVRYVERLPNPPADDRRLPDLCFAFYDRMVIFDHINKTIAVVAHAHVPRREATGEEGWRLAAEAAFAAACRRIDDLVDLLRQPGDNPKLTDIVPIGHVRRPFTSNFTRTAYEQAVEKAKEYI